MPKWIRRWLGGGVATAVLSVAVYSLTREPRFEGRTAEDWLDSMGSPDEATSTSAERLRASSVRREIEAIGERMLPAIGQAMEKAAGSNLRGRRAYMKKFAMWVGLGSLHTNRFGLAPPGRDPELEATTSRRLFWGGYLLLDLGTDRVTGLARWESVATNLPSAIIGQASSGFRVVVDKDGSLAAALTKRIQSSAGDPLLHRAWITGLGLLASTNSGAVNLIRARTRHPDTEVRRAAIEALGGIDRGDDAVSFIRGCATDTAGRQAAMLALSRMGDRARAAEDFVRDGLKDRDMLTSLFAKFALEALGAPVVPPEREASPPEATE